MPETTRRSRGCLSQRTAQDLAFLSMGCFVMRLDYHFGGPEIYRGATASW